MFNFRNIIPFLKKYKKNPVNGQPLKISELIKLNFHKNNTGDYHDPVSFKVFTDFTNVVAIKTTGNVYSKETVDQYNKKAKYYFDLITSEPFTSKDIIILQDPINVEKRTVDNFEFIKNGLEIPLPSNEIGSQIENFINVDATAKRVLGKLKEHNDEFITNKKIKREEEEAKRVILDDFGDPNSTNAFVIERLKKKDLKHSRETTDQVSFSVTSTLCAPEFTNELRDLSEDEIRKYYYSRVKDKQKKGKVQFTTNFGSFVIEIHCDFVPKASENFLELCEKHYFDNMTFHRFIQNFMIQGGDPTGTGTGGQSIFGVPFKDEFHQKLSHSKMGMLSMANSGSNSNGSQFFITLGECKYLDNKHSVFGEIISGLPVIEKMNLTIETGKNEKPKIDVVIYQALVLSNPFREAIKEIQADTQKIIDSENKIKIQNESDKLRWLSNKSEISNLQRNKYQLEEKPQKQSEIKKILNEFNK